MATDTARRMTAEEFFEWANRPENAGHQYELVRGELVAMSRPGERHGVVCMNVAYLLTSYTRSRRQGYVLSNDAGVIWERDPDTVRGPDVMLYNQNRRWDELHPKYRDTPPLLAVEVLSPWDRINQITRRIIDFHRTGTAVVWLIDPEDRTVAVYRPGQAPDILGNDDDLIGDPELPAFRCRVVDLFYAPGDEPPAP